MDIDVFILIGGRSTRLGMDKAFVELGGETLASRAARIADEALKPKRITFVTSDDAQFKPELVFGLGRPVVADIKPGFGAWSGVDTALGYAQGEWILVLACDLPLVSVDLVRLLASRASGDADAVVPRQPDGRPQPLCALFRVKPTIAAVESIFTGRSILPPMHTIFDGLRTCFVGFDDYRVLPNAERLFLNVNRADDLIAAAADNFHDFG